MDSFTAIIHQSASDGRLNESSMKSSNSSLLKNRRLLAKFLACSPFLSIANPSLWSSLGDAQDLLITDPSKALNVFDFKKVAKKKLSRAHFGYIETGVLDDLTLWENEKAFKRLQLKIRQLSTVGSVSTDTKLFGKTWGSPIFMSPCGSQKAFHADGEVETARGAKSQNHLQVLSNMSSSSIEEVSKARGTPVWMQLYPSKIWDDTMSMIERAERAGSEVLVITIDSNYQDKRETYLREVLQSPENCQSCHGTRNVANYLKNKPMVNSLSEQYQFDNRLTWEFVRKLRKATSTKIVLKGIVSKEDAEIALDLGVDGIFVSNHGGRVAESGKAALDSLSEVAEIISGRIPVLMDGGVRRGKDVFKALAKGADMVGIGRPYLWGLSSFGQEGVEMVLQILNGELKLSMQQTGVESVPDINESHLA